MKSNRYFNTNVSSNILVDNNGKHISGSMKYCVQITMLEDEYENEVEILKKFETFLKSDSRSKNMQNFSKQFIEKFNYGELFCGFEFSDRNGQAYLKLKYSGV